MLTNFERAPVTQTTFRLDVHGGARSQTVLIPATAEISMPARIVLGPFDARAAVPDNTYEAPYLFVVDQRRLGRGQGGGATRGQLVRINPAGYRGHEGPSAHRRRLPAQRRSVSRFSSIDLGNLTTAGYA